MPWQQQGSMLTGRTLRRVDLQPRDVPEQCILLQGAGGWRLPAARANDLCVP